MSLIENEQDDYEQDEYQMETSFNHDSIIQHEANHATLRYHELELNKLDKQINALERVFKVKIPSHERIRFRLLKDHLQVSKPSGEYVNLTKNNGEFLASPR